MELNDIWVVDLSQNMELLFKKTDFFLNIGPFNTLNCVFDFRVADPGRQADLAELSSTNQFVELVDLTDVEV